MVKDGIVYDADTLDEVWPDPKPFGDYYWVDEDALMSDDRPTDYWDRARGNSPGGASARGSGSAGADRRN